MKLTKLNLRLHQSYYSMKDFIQCKSNPRIYILSLFVLYSLLKNKILKK
jgi:hypothetical protein